MQPRHFPLFRGKQANEISPQRAAFRCTAQMLEPTSTLSQQSSRLCPTAALVRPISHSPGHPGSTTSVSQAGSSPQERSSNAENPEPALTTPPGFPTQGQHWKGLLVGTLLWAEALQNSLSHCSCPGRCMDGEGWEILPCQGLGAAHLEHCTLKDLLLTKAV